MASTGWPAKSSASTHNMGGSQPNASNYAVNPLMAYQMQGNLLQSQMQNQAGQFQNYTELLKMASKMPPQMQDFNAMQTSKEAGELGMANLGRSRQYEELTNPQAAAIRQGMGQRVSDLTSDKYNQDWANQLFKRGIIEGQQTGLAGGSLGANAFADQSLEQKRQRDLQNLQIQQQYLQQNPAPSGGLAPGQLISGEMAAKAANMNAQNNWMRSIYGGAQNLLGTMSGMQNQGYQNMLGLQQSGLEGLQNYGNMEYESAANSAASQNALLGAGIGAGGAALGTIGAAVII